jgi:hypothetical protein
MSGQSGRPSSEPFANWDPAGLRWRTSQQSLELANLPEPQAIWPVSGTWDLGGAYEHRTSGHLTAAPGSSSSPLLPMPTVSDANGIGAHGDGGSDLRTSIHLLPAAWATDGSKGGPNQRGSSGDLMLPSAVQQFLPTPTARDWRGHNQRHDASCLPGALLPTPTVADANGTRAARGGGRSNELLLTGIARTVSTGPDTDRPSDAGKPSSDAPPQHLPLWDDEAHGNLPRPLSSG